MIEWLGDFGASLTASALSAAWFFGSLVLSLNLYNRLEPRLPAGRLRYLAGAVIFAAIAFAVGVLIMPTVDVLERHPCRNAKDFEACMDPPAPDY